MERYVGQAVGSVWRFMGEGTAGGRRDGGSGETSYSHWVDHDRGERFEGNHRHRDDWSPHGTPFCSVQYRPWGGFIIV
jgi:hypothetical protein